MSLSVSTIRRLPPALVLSGCGGIGKTTLAASFPKPLFLLTEHPGNNLQADALNEGKPYTSHVSLINDLNAVLKEKHDYRTLVLDAADGLERLANEKVCAESQVDTIADMSFGRGYARSFAEFDRVLRGFDVLREYRGMTIIVIAHVEIERYEDPATASYSRWQIKLYRRLAMRLHDWSETHLFCAWQTAVKKEDKGFGKERGIGIGTGERIIWTEERPSHMAKNRYAMPEQIPMNFASINEFLKLEV